MKDELDKLFQERNERIDKAAEDARQAKEQADNLRNHALELLNTIFVPVLREFESELSSRGHSCRVAVGETSTPRVVFGFQLEAPGTRGRLPESTLTFVANPKVQVNWDVWTPKGKVGNGALPMKDLQSVDQEWVRKEVLSFVARVIRGA
ncbi:hypothetical protein L1F06_000720 [Ectopseudomonas hydrolytica]|uniref:Uncharacterized protein n=1 Tax=Ectopseudomonas hydrolytica TaxID=2493633 RepID=A0ABY5A9D3_9GAMM|nr:MULTISPECIES: hypothetical protein [Pseudomonas]MDH0095875.1 hypothetical protein [Pseudomonas sp. GD04158]USR39991.1 hypothetical protein L1F06_000720 [Pseudomonas hydrolytica]